MRKDVEFPSAAINPDHVGSLIELTDGDTVTAIIQREGSVSRLRLTDEAYWNLPGDGAGVRLLATLSDKCAPNLRANAK